MKKLTLESGKVIEISDESYKALSDGIREKRWVPNGHEDYYSVTDGGQVVECSNRYQCVTDFHLNTGNCFPTSTKAQAHADKLKAIAKVTEYIYSNNLESDDQEFKTGDDKYNFNYDLYRSKIYTQGVSTIKVYSPIPYIKDIKSAEQVLENCKEELLKIYK